MTVILSTHNSSNLQLSSDDSGCIQRSPLSRPMVLNENTLALHVSITQTEFSGWAEARQRAWDRRFQSPSRYFYNHLHPRIPKKVGHRFSLQEHYVFLSALRRLPTPCDWGAFSLLLPGRIGSECRRYFKLCRDAGFVNHKGVINRSVISKASVLIKKNQKLVGNTLFLKKDLKKFIPHLKKLAQINDFWLKDLGDGVPSRQVKMRVEMQISNWLKSHEQKKWYGIRVSTTPTATVKVNKRRIHKSNQIQNKAFKPFLKKVDFKRKFDQNNPIRAELGFLSSTVAGTNSSTTASACTSLHGDIDASDMSPVVNRRKNSTGRTTWHADSSEAVLKDHLTPQKYKMISVDNSYAGRFDESECTEDHDIFNTASVAFDQSNSIKQNRRISIDFIVNSQDEDDSEENFETHRLQDVTNDVVTQAKRSTAFKITDNVEELVNMGLQCAHYVKWTRELVKIFCDEGRKEYSKIDSIKRRVLLGQFDEYVEGVLMTLKTIRCGDGGESADANERRKVTEKDCFRRCRSFMDEMDELQSYQQNQKNTMDMLNDVMVGQ